MLLTEPSDEEIEAAFAKAGMHIQLPRDSREVDQRLPENTFWKYASSAMDLPGPLDFQNSNAEDSTSASFINDLLQKFHSIDGRHRNGNRPEPEKDRRLNLMRHHCENGVEEDELSTRTRGTRRDENSSLKFLGEQLVSSLFQRELGKHYDPVAHWTSPLRTRAGLPKFANKLNSASFTMSTPVISGKVTKLLSKRGWKSLAQHHTRPLSYHFDIGVSAGGLEDAFEWTTSQLQMAQEFRYLNPYAEGLQTQKNVHILIRITNVYTEPKFTLVLDPWSHFNFGALQLEPDSIFKASLRLTNRQAMQQNFSHARGSDPWSDIGASIRISDELSGRMSFQQFVPEKQTVQPRTLATPRPEHLTKPKVSPSQPQRQLYMSEGPQQAVSSALSDRKRKRSPSPRAESSEILPPAKRLAPAVITLYSYKYKYIALRENEIRLFTLFPGEDTERLQGILWTTDSRTARSYKTLSYVWGPNNQPMHILRTPSGALSIRNTLHAALISLRQRSVPLTLWIDALCINQDDNGEKSRQIRLLPEIFQRSVSTLAFIGGSEDHSEAIQMLMQVRARMLLSPCSDQWPEDLPHCPSSWEEKGMPPPQDEIWAKVAAFFENTWFRRAWIVQEAVIARRLTIVCGKTSIDWNHLFLVMEHISEELVTTGRGDSKPWIPFLKLARLRHMEDRSGRVSILKLLENFRHAKSSDPRDKFFSLLGIASDGNLEEFEPDYSSPLEEIIQRFAVALFSRFSNEGQAMLLLYRAGLSHSPVLPSWIPDWLEEKPNGLHDSLGRGTDFNACGDLLEQIRYVPDTGELEVEAYLVDEVEYVTESNNGPQKQMQKRYFDEIKYLLDEVFGDVWEPEQIQRVLWEAPVAGAKHPKVALPGDLSIHDSWKAFMRLLRMKWLDEDADEAQSPRNESDLEAQSRVYQENGYSRTKKWMLHTFF